MINGNMFNLIGIDPFDFGETNFANGFCNLGKEMNRLLGSVTNYEKGYRQPCYSADRTETQDTFYVELPGCKKEDIKVTVSGDNALMVEAKRTGGKKEFTYKTEIFSDKDVDNAELSYVDGILTVTVTPRAKVEPEVKMLQIK